MGKNILIVILITFTSFNIFSQDVKIKSLKYFPGENGTAFPVLTLDETNRQYLTIDFDIQANSYADMNILFRFCDKYWKPYDNVFLANYGKNTLYNLSLDKLPTNIEGADYHFHGRVPDRNGYVEFPFSGNWMFYVTDSQDTSKVYCYGKFYVVENMIEIQDTIKNEKLEGQTYFPNDLGKVFNITAKFILTEKLFPGNVDNTTIIENEKIDFPFIIGKSFNTNTRQFYWDGNRNFSFTARDIQPGNEYRQVDLRNINKFNSKNVRAQFDGLEYSRFFKQGRGDLNGSSKIVAVSDPYSTYMNVAFSIKPPDDVYGDVFLVGAFNNWNLDLEYRMNYESGIFSKTIELKRGVYDYQYVVADFKDGKIVKPDWQILEGNSWDTSNEYNIFVYYNETNFGGYDRIIGHSKIISKRR